MTYVGRKSRGLFFKAVNHIGAPAKESLVIAKEHASALINGHQIDEQTSKDSNKLNQKLDYIVPALVGVGVASSAIVSLVTQVPAIHSGELIINSDATILLSPLGFARAAGSLANIHFDKMQSEHGDYHSTAYQIRQWQFSIGIPASLIRAFSLGISVAGAGEKLHGITASALPALGIGLGVAASALGLVANTIGLGYYAYKLNFIRKHERALKRFTTELNAYELLWKTAIENNLEMAQNADGDQKSDFDEQKRRILALLGDEQTLQQYTKEQQDEFKLNQLAGQDLTEFRKVHLELFKTCESEGQLLLAIRQATSMLLMFASGYRVSAASKSIEQLNNELDEINNLIEAAKSKKEITERAIEEHYEKERSIKKEELNECFPNIEEQLSKLQSQKEILLNLVKEKEFVEQQVELKQTVEINTALKGIQQYIESNSDLPEAIKIDPKLKKWQSVSPLMFGMSPESNSSPEQKAAFGKQLSLACQQSHLDLRKKRLEAKKNAFWLTMSAIGIVTSGLFFAVGVVSLAVPGVAAISAALSLTAAIITLGTCLAIFCYHMSMRKQDKKLNADQVKLDGESAHILDKQPAEPSLDSECLMVSKAQADSRKEPSIIEDYIPKPSVDQNQQDTSSDADQDEKKIKRKLTLCKLRKIERSLSLGY